MAGLTQEGMEKIIEMLQRVMDEQKRLNQSLVENFSKKMDDMVTESRNDSKLFRKEIREDNRLFRDELSQKLDEQHKILDDQNKKMREDREELRKEKTEEIKNDNKPETEEIPNDKTEEKVVVLPEKKTKGSTETVSYTHLDVYKRQLFCVNSL